MVSETAVRELLSNSAFRELCLGEAEVLRKNIQAISTEKELAEIYRLQGRVEATKEFFASLTVLGAEAELEINVLGSFDSSSLNFNAKGVEKDV